MVQTMMKQVMYSHTRYFILGQGRVCKPYTIVSPTRRPQESANLIPAARALRDSARPHTFYVINMNL